MKIKPWGYLLLITTIISVAAAAVITTWHFCGDQIKSLFVHAEEPKPLTLIVNGGIHTKDADGLTLDSGAQITVQNANAFTVSVTNIPNDAYTFTVSGMEKTWSDFEPADLTADFAIRANETGFTLYYPVAGDVVAKLADAMPDQIELINVPETNIYRLTVTDEQGRSVSVSFGFPKLSLEVTPPNIIL